mgnify:FL=1
MKRYSSLALLGALAFSQLHSAAWAAERTVTLSVPGMYCAMCPVSIKAALNKVNGVIKTAASYDTKEAVVSFDDAKTNVEALTKATTDAGYPATVKK